MTATLPPSIAGRAFTARKGDVLFRPGDPCPGFLILDRGRIRVTLTAANGREVVLYRVGPGSICLQTFSCLIEGDRYGAEGVVEEDVAGELVPADAFRGRIDADPAFRDLVFTAVASRFGEYQRLVEDVALSGLDARLARTLLRLADDAGRVPATHAALAVETASGRAVVSRRLGDLAGRGIVAQDRGGLRILDRRALERIAADEG